MDIRINRLALVYSKLLNMSALDLLQDLVSLKFTKDVLKDILCKKSNCKEVAITELTLGESSKKGDSYISKITRLCVQYCYQTESGHSKTEKIYIIVKSLPKNIARIKTFRTADFFKNEIVFFEEVWPKLDAFQKSKGIKNIFEDIPIYLAGYADGIHDYVALEDLSYLGYGSAQRSEGLNYEHTIMIIRVFAKFHALGLAFKDQNPTEFIEMAECLQETYFSEKLRSWYQSYQDNLKLVVEDAVDKELPEKYLKKVHELFSSDFYGTLSNLCAKQGPLAVVTHGDAWVPNFLMKYEENSNIPLNAIMIDFQLARCASLSLDLHFFLYSCTDQKLREKYYDVIIEEYQKTAASFLKDLGSNENLLTLDILKKDLKECGAFGIGMSMEAVVVSLLEDDEVSDIDSIQGDCAVPLGSVWIVKPLKSAEKRKRLADLIKHCVDYEYV